MPSRPKRGLILTILTIALIFTQVEYGHGAYFIEYEYDDAGNLKKRKMTLDDAGPTGSVSINLGAAYTNNANVTLALTCSDAVSGCSQMQFSNDGSTYSTPETFITTKTWTLTSGDGTKTVYAKFKDGAGNWSTAYTDTIILDTTSPVWIGSTPYSTIQAAYNAAVSGNVIKCRDFTLTQSLTVNRNISVSLEGGYNAGFTTNYGTMTTLKGMITTTTGGGTLTIENFTLVQ